MEKLLFLPLPCRGEILVTAALVPTSPPLDHFQLGQVSGKHERVQGSRGHRTFYGGEPHHRFPRLSLSAAIVHSKGHECHRHPGHRGRATGGKCSYHAEVALARERMPPREHERMALEEIRLSSSDDLGHWISFVVVGPQALPVPRYDWPAHLFSSDTFFSIVGRLPHPNQGKYSARRFTRSGILSADQDRTA